MHYIFTQQFCTKDNLASGQFGNRTIWTTINLAQHNRQFDSQQKKDKLTLQCNPIIHKRNEINISLPNVTTIQWKGLLLLQCKDLET